MMMDDESTTGRDFRDDILREQVRLAFRQLPTMQAASFIVALALSYTVRNIAPRVNIVIWISMILTIIVSRIFLYFRFVKLRSET
jgi:hypothetical protein